MSKVHFCVITQYIPVQYTSFESYIYLFCVGELSLPHSEIKEPFEAWYDLKENRSRIDYRNGQWSSHDKDTVLKSK